MTSFDHWSTFYSMDSFESDLNWLFKNFPFFSVISVYQLYILSLLLKSDIARSPGHIRLVAEKRE